MRYTVVQGCVVPAQLAPFLSDVLHDAAATLNSCYRGADAESLLHRLGKKSQTELYDDWTHRRPGANPANPPGFSTHELRNDGAAYPQWPRGHALPWWACGIDVNDADVEHVLRVAARRGWQLAQTYPNSRAEFHHINFRKPPLLERVKPVVKKALPVPGKQPAHLSTNGAQFIGRFEGFRAEPYNDPVGFATIGYGHLLHRSRVTTADQARWGKLTEAKALKLLQQDAEAAAWAVHAHVKARLNQAQFDALVSFTFNLGTGAFIDSTLLKKLNQHPGTSKGVTGFAAKAEVRAELMKWNKAGGRELEGLTVRRRAEADLFATGRYR